ncbi:uncharacterized protein LOC135488650 [Lineus longissimus]|uniref:uncharacterized protein LOC135488650 n=1 Tax=Lineus longissimus TaxID=88925 RepID=UPI002B4EFE04
MASGGGDKVEFRNIDDIGLSEEDPVGFVRVVVLIPDFKITKKFMGKSEAARGSKVVVQIEERSMLLEATVKDKKKGILVTHKLEYRVLPHPVDKSKSKHKLEDGRIIILLKKKDDISWTEYMMSEHGLETDIPS